MTNVTSVFKLRSRRGLRQPTISDFSVGQTARTPQLRSRASECLEHIGEKSLKKSTGCLEESSISISKMCEKVSQNISLKNLF